jgi:hypothetical protein
MYTSNDIRMAYLDLSASRVADSLRRYHFLDGDPYQLKVG